MLKPLAFILPAVLSAAQLATAGLYSDYNETTHAIDPAIAATIGGQINPIFTAWANGYENYLPTPGVSIGFQTPQNILGTPDGTIVSLGDLDQNQIDSDVAPGEITLTFDKAIYNGPGADFAVFENSSYFSGYGLFGELGYVEVSSNGTDFIRFGCVSTNAGPVGGYGVIDGTNVYNLVGKHQKFYGTPFDLDNVAGSDAVLSGLVDINNIQYVKIVDIPGSGDFTDSQDNPIYDAWVTVDSGGVDLDAIGAINTVPEPSSLILLAMMTMALLTYCRGNRPLTT